MAPALDQIIGAFVFTHICVNHPENGLNKVDRVFAITKRKSSGMNYTVLNLFTTRTSLTVY